MLKPGNCFTHLDGSSISAIEIAMQIKRIYVGTKWRAFRSTDGCKHGVPFSARSFLDTQSAA